MSGLDDALRRHTAAQRSADDARTAEMNARYRAAEAAVPRIVGLLREFAQRLAASGVEPVPVEIGSRSKKTLFGSKRVTVMSPPGYVLHRQRVLGGGIWLGLVTPAGELFSKESDDSGEIVPITAQNILDGKVYCGGKVRVSTNGKVVGVLMNYEPERWESLEDNIARSAVQLMQNPEWWA